MTIQRMDHVGIVVDDLTAAIEFFVALGLEPNGDGAVQGGWVDRIVGLDDIRVPFAFMETPDGNGRLELVKFLAPAGQAATGSRQSTRQACAISHSPSRISTPSWLACEPAERSSSAR